MPRTVVRSVASQLFREPIDDAFQGTDGEFVGIRLNRLAPLLLQEPLKLGTLGLRVLELKLIFDHGSTSIIPLASSLRSVAKYRSVN